MLTCKYWRGTIFHIVASGEDYNGWVRTVCGRKMYKHGEREANRYRARNPNCRYDFHQYRNICWRATDSYGGTLRPCKDCIRELGRLLKELDGWAYAGSPSPPGEKTRDWGRLWG